MKCFNCGLACRSNERVCPNCGVSFEEYFVDEALLREGGAVRSRKSTKRNNKNSALIAVICAAIALVLVALIVIFVLLADSKRESGTKYICAFCDNEVNEDEQYCDDCSKSRFCKICDKFIEEGDVYCKKCKDKHSCKSCGVVKDYIEDYCISCEEKLPECALCESHFEGEGSYCEDCIKEYNVENSRCFGCHRPMEDEENYYIAKNANLVFCSQCDSGDYCKDCDIPIADGNSDGTYCNGCRTYDCFGCGKPTKGDDAACMTFDDYVFCKDCDTGTYCGRCMAPIEDGKACSACGYKKEKDFTCLGCGYRFKMSEASYNADIGYYCRDCDTGIYCNRCPLPVERAGLCDTCSKAFN